MRITKVIVLFFVASLLILAGCSPHLKATPTGPAVFTVSDLVIASTILRPDESTTVSVNVTNTGGDQGTYTVVMKVDDFNNPAVFKTQNVTLAGGTSQKVIFVYTPSSFDGDQQISIDKLSGTIAVGFY